MTQRTLAGLMAVVLLGVVVAVLSFRPLAFVSYEPGSTIDVLGKSAGKEIIQVTGHKAYRDSGELRMTTVLVSTPTAKLDLFTLMTNWLDPNDAVYPYDAVYAPNTSAKENRQQGQAEMVDSQQAATAVAQDELGLHVVHVMVRDVTQGMPAQGKLEKGDELVSIDGHAIGSRADVQTAIQGAPADKPLDFVVRRGGREVTSTVTPTLQNGSQIVGIQIGVDFDHPFDVTVGINPKIGGPSAGLMFSVGIYDTLTPGSLTGGNTIAGTGTMDEGGAVGPIGGIMQKIVGAKNDGAKLFLVPPDNCDEALQAHNGDMRLVKAVTMHSAVQAIKTWVKQPEADLPQCRATAEGKAEG
ncbi:MAG: PDZ domain-containing protein [Nocardioides sp.]